MIIYLSLLVAIVGLLMYALCANPKLQEAGRIMFAMGTLAFLLQVPALVGPGTSGASSVPHFGR